MEDKGKNKLNRQLSSLGPDFNIKKNKIFSINDPSLRKTKIICTIG
jgi:hypothetical protein